MTSKTFATLPLSVNAKVWDEQPDYTNELLAQGMSPKGEKFGLIRSVPESNLVVHVKGQYYEINVADVLQALFVALGEDK